MIFFFAVSSFLVISGSCAPTKSYPVPNPLNGTCLYDGLTMADPFDQTAYYQCCQHMWFLKYCLQGFVFDKINLICISENEIPTVPTSTKKLHFTSTKSQFCIPGDKQKNELDDSKFEECINGTHWETKSCQSGLKFNSNTKECESRPTENPIDNGFCQESMGQNGYKPNPENCQTYFQCVHGKWQLRNCGAGTQWDQSILGCDFYNGVC